MSQLSFRQYRAIDLGILAAILFAAEMIAALAASKWFPGELYTFSPTIAVICIVMMRWNGYAAVHAAAGGLAFCLASSATAGQFAVYCAGNCFALIALVLFKVFGKEKIRSKPYLTVIFTAAAFCGAQAGRWLISLFFGASADSFFDFFAADSLSLLFAVVVVLISRRADGLFEDQKSYLIRTEAERRRQQDGLM